ncbi:hypothetical protein K439DRAFT_1159190 [Ramaria rubella]|nr:hypothetical protein K439DRAFT_1159190 [Ramaria rubella]
MTVDSTTIQISKAQVLADLEVALAEQRMLRLLSRCFLLLQYHHLNTLAPLSIIRFQTLIRIHKLDLQSSQYLVSILFCTAFCDANTRFFSTCWETLQTFSTLLKAGIVCGTGALVG